MILDAWGHQENPENNAIHSANTPTWDALVQTCRHPLIKTSGKAVGLPEGQMGNSEVGHMNLGAGRVVYQNLSKINHDISSGRFFENRTLLTAINKTINNNSTLHILGLLSPGGIHSYENQISALIHGDAIFQFGTPEIALKAAYVQSEDDEFVQPTIICDEKNSETPTKRNDIVMIMNFRSDRSHQLIGV